MSLTGQCHCGAVRFQANGEAVGVIACHCRDCQQMHGNYMAIVATEAAQVTFEMDDTLIWYESSAKAKRGFCSKCGSRLFKRINDDPRLLISAGVIDPPTGKHIVKNLWEQSKGDWYDLPKAEA